MKIMKNQTAELEESLGAALLPVVEALVPMLVALADVAAENTGAIKILIGVVAGLSAAILAINGVMKAAAAAQLVWKAAVAAATAVQWLWNAAMSANPIGLIILALAALGLALVAAYKKSETFRDIVDGALDVVKSAVNALDRAFDAARAPPRRRLQLDRRPLEARPVRVRPDRRRRLSDLGELRQDRGGRPGARSTTSPARSAPS